MAKTAMSSLKESEEQTSPPATPGSRGVQVASSHFSKTRANRGNNGCLTGSATQRHTYGDGVQRGRSKNCNQQVWRVRIPSLIQQARITLYNPSSSSRAWARNRKEKRPGPFPQLRSPSDLLGEAPGHFNQPNKKSFSWNVMKYPRSSVSLEPGVDPDPFPTLQRRPNQPLRHNPDLPRKKHCGIKNYLNSAF